MKRKLEIRLWRPFVDGKQIDSIEKLYLLIDGEYPRLKENPQFELLIKDAQDHLFLVTELRAIQSLDQGDISKLTQQVCLSYEQVRRYIRRGVRPKIYRILDDSISVTKAKECLSRVYYENTGIMSTKDMIARLASYYPIDFLFSSTQFQSHIKRAEKYFEVCRYIRKGGEVSAIAKKVEINKQRIRSWFFRGAKPYLVKLSSQIPRKSPGRYLKWLPLEMKSRYEPRKFIKVPISVKKWTQIVSVLDRINSLKNRQINNWLSIFGKTSKEEAFSYVLGMLVSDSGKEYGGLTSTSLRLKLSSEYEWSERVGEALCFYLGILGITTSRPKEGKRSENVVKWSSQHSPLISWMIKTCLGLDRSERTSRTPVKADWLLQAPHLVRLRFLQGINDGDGCASLKAQEITVCGSTNISFIENLLSTFKIKSYSSPRKGVSIKNQEGIILAAKLPFFLHATDRQSNADILHEMMQKRKTQRYKPLDDDVINLMRELQANGNSVGTIAELIFKKYGISLGHSSIRNHLSKRH